MTDAPPPTAWLDADDHLQQRLAALDTATRNAHATLHDAVRADVVEPIRTLTAEIAARHRRLMEEHGFDRPLDAPPRPPAVLWDALTAYRLEMTAAHTAFRDRLRDLDLGATLGARFTHVLDTLAALAEDMPATVVRPEPDGLIDAEAGDSVALLGRKMAERTRRRQRRLNRSVANGFRRLVRKAPQDAAPAAQSVLLRALVEEQVRVRLPHTLAVEHERVQTEVGRGVAELEGAFTIWANELLRLESKLDRPRFHATDAIAWAAPPAASADPEAPASPAAPPPDVALPEVRRVREVAQALDAALHGFHLDPTFDTENVLDDARDALAERVRRSGFDSDRAAAPGEGEPLAELATAVERWSGWHRMVVRRMDVDGLLLDLRERLVEEVESLIVSVTEAVVTPVIATVDQAGEVFGTLRTEAVEACDELSAPAPLAEALQHVLDPALDHMDQTMMPALQSISLDRAVEDSLAAMRQRLGAAVDTLPEQITLYARLGPERVGQTGHAADVELRRIVRTTLSEEFVAHLIKSTDALRQPLFKAISGAEGVRDIVRYNIETAIDELEHAALGAAPPSGEENDRDADEDVLANARELTVDGLARAEERLHGITAPLAAPWQAFIRRATETFEKSWSTLHDRANAANLVEAQFLDFKTRAQRTLTRAQRGTAQAAERALHTSQKWMRVGRIGAKRLVQIGQAAAGLAAQSEADRQRTLDAIAESAHLHANLPLVYRRLFSFAPLTDATLFESRVDQIARVTEHANRWRAGRDSSALIVTSDPGSGRTSFLNILRATVFADDDPATVHLTERTDEPTVARQIADALGVEGITSFEDLETYLISRANAGRKQVCLIEGLEHLLLRAPGGLDLIERTFIFMSRTDAHVLWIGAMWLLGWRFVERTAPQVTGLVDPIELPPFTRAQIESALVKRHARSGLPLVFAEPTDPSPLLARRLGKAASPEARQEILHAEFFDGLYRASGPNMMLALLYWLRAADFEATADTLTLRPVRPLDFAFVGAFDLPRSFALKALLQHGTLTLTEHDRIFRTSRDESFLIFESLHNQRLIQPASGPEAALQARRNGTPAVSHPVQEGVRYRLHPLVIAPVTDALRAKNML